MTQEPAETCKEVPPWISRNPPASALCITHQDRVEAGFPHRREILSPTITPPEGFDPRVSIVPPLQESAELGNPADSGP